MISRSNEAAESLENVLSARGTRRALNCDTTRFRYANACLYRPFHDRRPECTLYVGVGHGLDAILALADGLTETAVGVDPYIAEDGNDSLDYRELLKLIDDFNLEKRFQIIRERIQEYLEQSRSKFDFLVCNDVLHHIFWTEDLLSHSKLFLSAASFFESLARVSFPHARLAIGEPERHGFRQLLAKAGILRTSINYDTKQPWREWVQAAAKGGWSLVEQTNYVPWRFRNGLNLWSGAVGRYTVCDRYFLYFRLTKFSNR